MKDFFIYIILICFIFIPFIVLKIDTIKGDVNHDGKISCIDVVKVRRYILGLDDPNLIDKFCMDVNCDFVIDDEDIDGIRRIIVGLD